MTVLGEALRLVRAGIPGVLATVVKTSGSTPQKPGARLLVRGDGSLLGTLGGGCVEADVWSRAMALLGEGGSPEVAVFHLNEPLETGEGLVCGGTMSILLEPLGSSHSLWLEAASAALAGGEAVAVATLLSPGLAGSRLLAREDGSVAGSLGDSGVETSLVSAALDLVASPEPGCRWLEVGGKELFLEAFASPPTLLLAGGGHIGKALAEIAPALGFRVVVVDERPEFASRERFPRAEEVLTAPFLAITSLPLTPRDAVVVATPGHKQDQVALEAACRTGAGYVALVGSRRKAHLVFHALEEAGLPRERVGQVRCPAGLDIGARTPEEIALSILSEILMLRRGGTGRPLRVEPLSSSPPLSPSPSKERGRGNKLQRGEAHLEHPVA